MNTISKKVEYKQKHDISLQSQDSVNKNSEKVDVKTLDQVYLDLCTSWQCEPKYPDDVKMILENLIKEAHEPKH